LLTQQIHKARHRVMVNLQASPIAFTSYEANRSSI